MNALIFQNDEVNEPYDVICSSLEPILLKFFDLKYFSHECDDFANRLSSLSCIVIKSDIFLGTNCFEKTHYLFNEWVTKGGILFVINTNPLLDKQNYIDHKNNRHLNSEPFPNCLGDVFKLRAGFEDDICSRTLYKDDSIKFSLRLIEYFSGNIFIVYCGIEYNLSTLDRFSSLIFDFLTGISSKDRTAIFRDKGAEIIESNTWFYNNLCHVNHESEVVTHYGWQVTLSEFHSSSTFDLNKFKNLLNTITLGRSFIFGEVVSSTQEILKKNAHILQLMPDGGLFITSNQTQGRGRGSNKWISSFNSLLFSLVLRCESRQLSNLIQYLAAIALIESLNELTGIQELFEIKWPNDIYHSNRKLGGIIVDVLIDDSSFRFIIGAGLNVDHVPFAASINDVLNECGHRKLEKENILASFCNYFEADYNDWRKSKKFPFDKYYQFWTFRKNNRIQILDIQEPCFVSGVDANGFLLASRKDQEAVIALQPSMNSYDMIKGLIKRKT